MLLEYKFTSYKIIFCLKSIIIELLLLCFITTHSQILPYNLPNVVFVNSPYYPQYAKMPPYHQTWNKIFEDDFNGTIVDPAKWYVDNYQGHLGQDKVAMAENVVVSGGILGIKIDKKTIITPDPLPQNLVHGWPAAEPGDVFNYTFGTVTSVKDFEYGYFEARMMTADWEVPMLASFWLLVANNGGYPCEMDIIETSGIAGKPVNDVGFAMAYYGASDCLDANGNNKWDCPFINNPVSVPSPFSLLNQWHTHGMEWTPDQLIIYLDGAPIMKVKNHEIGGSIGNLQNILLTNWFHKDNQNSLKLQANNYPYWVYFDWVRVYEYGYEFCNENLLIDCNYNFSNHDNQVRKDITIASTGGCVNSLTVGDNVHLRVSNSLEVNGEFYVPIGAELYVDKTACQ